MSAGRGVSAHDAGGQPQTRTGTAFIRLAIDAQACEKQGWEAYWDALPDQEPEMLDRLTRRVSLAEALQWGRQRADRLVVNRYDSLFYSGPEPVPRGITPLDALDLLDQSVFLPERLFQTLVLTGPRLIHCALKLTDGRLVPDVDLDWVTGEVIRVQNSSFLEFASKDIEGVLFKVSEP